MQTGQGNHYVMTRGKGRGPERRKVQETFIKTKVNSTTERNGALKGFSGEKGRKKISASTAFWKKGKKKTSSRKHGNKRGTL